MHIVAIGAHALDAEVLSGALLAKYTTCGHRGTLIHMTRGERGDPRKPPEVYARQLEREMQKAASLLGCEVHWMGYPAGQAPISDAIALSLCHMIRELKPDLVITHWSGSWHPRHVATHHNVTRAIRLAADETVSSYYPAHRVRELYFGENCEDLDGFRPLIYFDITDVVERWFAALACYELYRRSQRETDVQLRTVGIPYDDYYQSAVRVRGLESGFTYAQAFMPSRRAVRGWLECTDGGICLQDSYVI